MGAFVLVRALLTMWCTVHVVGSVALATEPGTVGLVGLDKQRSKEVSQRNDTRYESQGRVGAGPLNVCLSIQMCHVYIW